MNLQISLKSLTDFHHTEGAGRVLVRGGGEEVERVGPRLGCPAGACKRDRGGRL